MDKSSVVAILVNLGTPEQPTSSAVRAFLNRFLSDPRVVPISPWLWQPLLKGVILPLRSPKVARLYQQIWMDGGSPLQVYSEKLAEKVSSCIQGRCRVRLAMNYSHPSLETVIHEEIEQGVETLIVLPLYPQYSVSTSASVFDACARALQSEYTLPNVQFIRQYYDWPGYCELLAEQIQKRHIQYSASYPLIFSYHGIPERYVQAGDPYARQCEQTTRRIVDLLALPDDAWKMSYQSRFGREPWVQPYTDELLTSLAADGVKAVDIISPAFSVDCLETLEEISCQLKLLFFRQGGVEFNYIPALNAQDQHAQILSEIILEHIR
ncbi:ferrochelatase [Celerinatantimonas sp. YJH-8]|uniref:ferrochelatase n=1 Tax=Celerinatantimonas sp. YJH-8 TaxID=3228714 RepID=UPI0038C936C3